MGTDNLAYVDGGGGTGGGAGRLCQVFWASVRLRGCRIAKDVTDCQCGVSVGLRLAVVI